MTAADDPTLERIASLPPLAAAIRCVL